MADTIQLVLWALGQTCRLRPSREDGFPECPASVLEQVREFQTYAAGLASKDHGFGVYGDICVTSVTHGARPGGKKTSLGPMIPSGGFVISKTFAPYGGIAALRSQCLRCPANITSSEIAQCAGNLHQRPDSPDTEEQLQGIISRLGLAKEMADRFPATTPRWYGLWAVSPVPSGSLPLLRLLLSEILEEDRRDTRPKSGPHESQFRQFEDIITAIDVAEQRKLLLHVELLPLGHTDFGVYTVFPHCPFCKACARTPRWRDRYPAELLGCHVCGTRFSPAETASRKRMKWDSGGLRKEMGNEAFQGFTAEYLRARGESPEEVPGILAATAEKERECEEYNRKRLEEERRSRAYVETHVYCDLPRLDPPPPEVLDGEDDEEEETLSETTGENAWFALEQIEEILQRCELLGVKIVAMFHRSRDESLTQYESISGRSVSPTETLARWKAKGFNEKFRVFCRVPKDLLQ